MNRMVGDDDPPPTKQADSRPIGLGRQCSLDPAAVPLRSLPLLTPWIRQPRSAQLLNRESDEPESPPVARLCSDRAQPP